MATSPASRSPGEVLWLGLLLSSGMACSKVVIGPDSLGSVDWVPVRAASSLRREVRLPGDAALPAGVSERAGRVTVNG